MRRREARPTLARHEARGRCSVSKAERRGGDTHDEATTDADAQVGEELQVRDGGRRRGDEGSGLGLGLGGEGRGRGREGGTHVLAESALDWCNGHGCASRWGLCGGGGGEGELGGDLAVRRQTRRLASSTGLCSPSFARCAPTLDLVHCCTGTARPDAVTPACSGCRALPCAPHLALLATAGSLSHQRPHGRSRACIAALLFLRPLGATHAPTA